MSSVLLAAAVLGCGSDNEAQTAGSGGGGAATASGALEKATAAVKAAKQRAADPPADTSRAAVPGKSLALIAFSGSESSNVPVEGAEAAAKAIGWTTKAYSADNDVGAITGLVRQALSTGADGIVLSAIDCAYAAKGFAEAKAKKVPVVAINGFDCDNKYSSGGAAAPLFAADIKTGDLELGQYFKQNGADVANAAIVDSGDKAKIISVENEELAVLRWISDGFNETIKASEGSEVVERLVFTTGDFVSGKLITQIQSALTQHPEATYVKSPFTGATLASVLPAVKTAQKNVKVLGGEGEGPEVGLVRSGRLVATSSQPGAWNGWAAIDTMNSVFREEDPVDSKLEWVLVDKSNAPASGGVEGKADFESAYRKAWGVG